MTPVLVSIAVTPDNQSVDATGLTQRTTGTFSDGTQSIIHEQRRLGFVVGAGTRIDQCDGPQRRL